MKQKIAFIAFTAFFATFLFISCKKEETLSPESIKFAQEFEACYAGKAFPQLPLKETYMSGEIDGKPFSISQSRDFGVFSSLSKFRAQGYKSDYAELEKNKEWLGNGFYVFPRLDTFPESSKHFDFMLSFAYFRGDSLTYEKYFTQFQKGYNFKIKTSSGSQIIEFGEIEFSIIVSGCAGLSSLQDPRTIISPNTDQTGSYCRVSDVKEYKSADGKIFRRDITIEFDVKVGGFGVKPKHIKNGKICFVM